MGRIIVIEDNIIYSDFVCRLLENKGFQCISTFNTEAVCQDAGGRHRACRHAPARR